MMRSRSPLLVLLVLLAGGLLASHVRASGDGTFAEPEETLDATSGVASADAEPAGYFEPMEPPPEDPLADLQQKFDALSEEWEKHKASLDKKAADAKKKPTFQIGGRIHLDYWGFPHATPGIGFFENSNPADADYGEDPEDAFRFRRIRLEMKGDILETMDYRMQIDFAGPADAEMKDVWVGFKDLPGNQKLRIGNQKRPLGLDHLNSSRFNVFLERPFVIEAFNADARRLGIAMYGNNSDDSFGWAYGVYNLENIKGDGEYRGDSVQLSGNARVFGSPWYDETSGGRGYWHWGLAGMVAHPDGDSGPVDENSNEARFSTRPEARSQSSWLDTGRIAGAEWYEVIGLETIVNVGAVQVTGEYQVNWVQRDNTGPDVFFHGAYVYVSYFLTGESMQYNRSSGTLARVKPYENFFLVDRCMGGHATGWGAWQIAARYSYLDVSDGDILGGVGHSITGALNWHWTGYSKLQLNVLYGEIDDHAPVGGFTSGDYLIVGARVAVDF